VKSDKTGGIKMPRKRTENKSLYDNDYRYTDEALKLDGQSDSALRPIVKEWCDKGYSPREIMQIIKSAVDVLCLNELILRSERK
jgi:hypothetical protein